MTALSDASPISNNEISAHNIFAAVRVINQWAVASLFRREAQISQVRFNKKDGISDFASPLPRSIRRATKTVGYFS